MKSLTICRYILIADYPGCPLLLGDILEADENGRYWHYEHDGMYQIYPQDYPHLFRLLKWYEHRKREQMPRFIKWGKEPDQSYFEVNDWWRRPKNSKNDDWHAIINEATINGRPAWLSVNLCYPITEEFYNLNKTV